MPELSLPLGLEGTDKLPRTNTELRNMLNNGNGLNISRPGVLDIKTVGGVARGGFEWNGNLYYVYSQELRKITNRETGDFIVNSTLIEGPEEIDSAIGVNTAVIVVKGRAATYTLDKSDVLTNVSGNPNFVAFSSVTHLNNRFIYVAADGSIVKFSDVGAGGTINSLSFFGAEETPDINKVVWVLKNYLYIGGTDSIQRFKDTGAFPVPFVSVGGSFDIGFIGGLVEADQSVIFVGRKRGQSPGIFEVGSRQAIKISNEAVDLILTTYTELELSQTIPGRINWLNSYDFETLELRRDSLLFFEGRWSRTDTVIDNISRPWLGGYIVEIDNQYFSGSDDKFGKFTDINFDFGNRITRIQKGTISHPDRTNFSIASLELGVSQGFNDGEAQSVGLRTSDNGILFGPTVYRELGLTGQYDQKLIWNDPGGLGNYEGFMAYELVTTGNLTFNSDYLVVEFEE